ncbi:HepT-like ribonuclease domain-containing protein [Gordonia sp. NPDC003424]
MERNAAKELLHICGWLERVEEINDRGMLAYMGDDLLHEAGDSLMMKLGEAANRLAKLGVLAPEGVEWALAVANRNFLIHQYDEINRDLTWLTLSRDLPAWRVSLSALIEEALAVIEDVAGEADSPTPDGDLE